MYDFLSSLDSPVWGPPLLVLLVGTGICLSTRLGLLQVFRLPKALKLIFSAEAKGQGDISSFAALVTALVVTVGIGNIVGVATAIKLDGPGALFWIWMVALFDMVTKCAEGVLAIKYCTRSANGDIADGPMHYIVNGMGKHWEPLAIAFSIFGVVMALSDSGTFTQVNSITDPPNNTAGWLFKVISLVLAVLVSIITFGGTQSISKVAKKIVPFMVIAYIVVTLTILAFHFDRIILGLGLVLHSAFTGKAVTGGFAGTTVVTATRARIARGISSNESGLGSAPIAAAAAKTEEPVGQGLVSMTGAPIDTIIICTLTGLSIIVTGGWSSNLNGATLMQSAFSSVFGNLGVYALTISLILSVFTTIPGWCYYGERCFEFLFGAKAIPAYHIVSIAMVALGGYTNLETIWVIAGTVNGLMAIPNLIILLASPPIIIKETRHYFDNHRLKIWNEFQIFNLLSSLNS